jgi:hypothetical protein
MAPTTETYTVTIERDLRTGVLVGEQWYKDGRRHREDGPAVVRRDPWTGVIVEEAWFKKDLFHRDDGPAAIERNAVTGRVFYSEWFKDDKKVPAPKRPRKRAKTDPKAQPPAPGL